MLVVLPIFYLSVLTIFLLFLSWLISQQVKVILLLESQFKYFVSKSQSEQLELQEIFAFTKLCIAKKCFTKAIVQSQIALKDKFLVKTKQNNIVAVELYNMLGFIYYEADQKDLAKTFYEKSLEIDGNYIIALNNLAKIYEDKKNFKKAEVLYNKVLSIDSNNLVANRRQHIIKTQMNT